MKHVFSNIECLVAHFDSEGGYLPYCKQCVNCGEFIPYPYDSECNSELKDNDNIGELKSNDK